MTQRDRRALCRLDELEERVARSFVLGSGERIILLRLVERVVGYLDSCPHEPGTSLCWKKDAYMDSARRHLVCSSHGALFRLTDGYCELGPCQGEFLQAIDVAVIDGDVLVRD